MMKFNYPINLAIASVLVVPAVTLQSGAANSLEETLQRTLIALENLTGVEQRVESRAPDAIEEVLSWTEPALPVGDDPAANDALLEQLRAEVGELQAAVDLTRQRDGEDTVLLPDPVANDFTPGLASGTTGLDESTRRRLSGGRFVTRSAVMETPTPAAADEAAVAVEAPARTPFEADGYTADTLLLGRSLYRLGRYAEAIEALKPRRDQADGRYWTARCLEKLGRSDEALEAYAAVIEMPEAEHLAERAREDVDFLNWRLEFDKSSGGARSQ